MAIKAKQRQIGKMVFEGGKVWIMGLIKIRAAMQARDSQGEFGFSDLFFQAREHFAAFFLGFVRRAPSPENELAALQGFTKDDASLVDFDNRRETIAAV